MDLKITLSTQDLESLITKLETYEKELTAKANLFLERLGKIGIDVINAYNGTGPGDSTAGTVKFDVTPGTTGKHTATITLSGTDILFIEFGAGIYYNNGNAHPLAAQYGYGVGTYPSSGSNPKWAKPAINPGYWWYTVEGQSHLSYGTQATMPVYRSTLEMRAKIVQVANEVFKIT